MRDIKSLLIPEIKGAYHQKEKHEFENFISVLFEDASLYDVYKILEGCSPDLIMGVISAFPLSDQVTIVKFFKVHEQKEIFLQMKITHQVCLIEAMPHDDRIDLLKVLPQEHFDSICSRININDRRDILRLYRYDEDSVGALMTTEISFFSYTMSVQEALKQVRYSRGENEVISYLYVTNEAHILVGVLSLKELILAQDNDRLESIMHTNFLRVYADEEKIQAAQIISEHDLISLPVVDRRGKLIGLVTVDDVVDTLIDEGTEHILSLGGVSRVENENYFTLSFRKALFSRLIWLLLLMCVAFISSLILKFYKSTIEQLFALVFFIPLMCSVGGNAGTQSSTVVVRGIALGEVKNQDFISLIKREFLLGTVMGVIIGLLCFCRAYWCDNSILLACTVGIATTGTLMMANFLGASLPVLLKKLNFDPAIMSAPLITSILDAFCLLLYFNTAIFLMKFIK